MTYIMILWLLSGGGIATVEFSNQEDCIAAGQAIDAKEADSPDWICVKK